MSNETYASDESAINSIDAPLHDKRPVTQLSGLLHQVEPVGLELTTSFMLCKFAAGEMRLQY